MKLLLFADGIVGEQITRFLVDNYRCDIAFLVTTGTNKIHEFAEDARIPTAVFESETGLLEKLNTNIDLGVLAWWPKIIKKPLLDTPKLGFINTHPSFLPHNRGKHYNFWALIERSPFGVSLHRVDDGIDTGDIVAQESIDYDWTDTGGTLYEKAQVAMVDLFCATYKTLRTGEFESRPQDLKLGSYHLASELESASKIDLNAQYFASDLINLMRARTFAGYPGSWFEDSGSRYEITVTIKKVG